MKESQTHFLKCIRIINEVKNNPYKEYYKGDFAKLINVNNYSVNPYISFLIYVGVLSKTRQNGGIKYKYNGNNN